MIPVETAQIKSNTRRITVTVNKTNSWMKIHIHAQVYQRIEDIAKAQGRATSDLVHDALVRYLGMEGVPLDDEIVYGRDDGKENKE